MASADSTAVTTSSSDILDLVDPFALVGLATGSATTSALTWSLTRLGTVFGAGAGVSSSPSDSGVRPFLAFPALAFLFFLGRGVAVVGSSADCFGPPRAVFATRFLAFLWSGTSSSSSDPSASGESGSSLRRFEPIGVAEVFYHKHSTRKH